MFDALVNITEFLWGTPLMILMVGVGLYLSARTGFSRLPVLVRFVRRRWGRFLRRIMRAKRERGS